MGNARTIGNLIYSGIPERFPELKFVSVESGVGWLPFFLEILDHQMAETAQNELSHLSLLPSDYFRRQFYGCFWFERSTIKPTVEFLGSKCLLFETDFPHPTCLYPRDDDHLLEAFRGLNDSDVKAILQDNAAELYRIDIS